MGAGLDRGAVEFSDCPMKRHQLYLGAQEVTIETSRGLQGRRDF